jgi:hypothetical protein
MYLIGMPKRAAYFHKDSVTWNELYKILLAWIDYGDDVFDSEYATLIEEYNRTTDETKRERLKIIFDIMELLRDNLYYFR